jgi:hypothetical protein
LGGKPAPDIVAAVLLEKMCYADLENLAKEMVEVQILMEKMEDFELDSAEMKEMEMVKDKCKPSSSDMSEGQEISNLVNCLEKSITNKEFKEKYVVPMRKSADFMLKLEALSEKQKKMVEKYAMDDPRMAKQKAKKEASVIEFTMRSFKRMLEAHFVESFSFGTWSAIAFKPTESSSFMFKEISMPDQNTGTTLAAEGIQAISLIDLAGCPARSSWTMLCVPDMNDISKCECSIKSLNESACESITPNFKKLCE